MSLTEAELDAKLEAHAAKVRTISDNAVNLIIANTERTKAKSIGSGQRYDAYTETGGDFLLGVLNAASTDSEVQKAGKASLDFLGINRVDSDQISAKATLGTTDSSGGWIVPNAIVSDIIKPQLARHPFRQICTVVTGINAFAVDIPYRSAAPNRAVIAPFGDLKENSNLAFGGYSATMWTLARIHDISKQMVRQSAGAAEQDVLSELAHAIALGEEYYILNGTGTTMPYGLSTALANAPASFTTAFTASATTLAGSIGAAIATAAGDLASRNVQANAALMSATSFWLMVRQGTDSSGFYINGRNAEQTVPGVPPGTLMTSFGIPVYSSNQLNSDDLIVGDFKSLKLYFGQEFRVDTTEVAGERWDRNEVGYRGEEEMGLDARPSVYSGNFQVIADIVP